MQAVRENEHERRHAAVFGATGGIGGALCAALAQRGWAVAAGSRRGGHVSGARTAFACDITDEGSVAAAAQTLRADPPELIVIATGVLTLGDGTGPERSYRQLDPEAMAEAFRVNTIGPALVAKHVLPLFPRTRAGALVMLGARVGSISDNRLGGWHSYRASKAALAMLIRNFALEMRRTHPQLSIIGLHPGTVDTRLSAPFQTNIPDSQLTTPARAADHILTVIEAVTPQQSGTVLDWAGTTVPA